jgi:hypothetical protein
MFEWVYDYGEVNLLGVMKVRRHKILRTVSVKHGKYWHRIESVAPWLSSRDFDEIFEAKS